MLYRVLWHADGEGEEDEEGNIEAEDDLDDEDDEPRGSGWTLQVKWNQGTLYVEITPEPGRILRDIAGHEGILSEIEQTRRRRPCVNRQRYTLHA